MTDARCAAVRRRLAAFHDEELGLDDQVKVQAHLRECRPCAAELRVYRAVGDALRAGAGAAQSHAALVDGLAQAVISRMKAEQEESLRGRVNRMFEDLHLVWAALGATGSAVACVALIVGICSFAVTERPDSLASVLAVMGSPVGSDLNPMQLGGDMVLPRADNAMFPSFVDEEEWQLTLAAEVRQDGRITGLELLHGDRQGSPSTVSAGRDMKDLLDTISTARFTPARNQTGGSPVAVNMIWMLANLTVRPKVPGDTHQRGGSPQIDVSINYRLPVLV